MTDRTKLSRVTARLNPRERAALRKVHRYVQSFCGKQPIAETIRFLIRDWSPK